MLHEQCNASPMFVATLTLQGSRGQVICKSASFNVAYRWFNSMIVCRTLQWDGSSDGAHP